MNRNPVYRFLVVAVAMIEQSFGRLRRRKYPDLDWSRIERGGK